MDRWFPESGVPPLMGGPALRWGVLAPGEIAGDFTRTVHRNTGQRVVAVASRSLQRANAFALQHGVSRVHAGYADLCSDDEVDIVYVAAPHPFHLPLALLAIGAGKHVLVEKPLAVTASEGAQIARAAREAGVFAGEAMWTRYLPQSAVLRQVIDRGDLGEVVLSTADVGWSASEQPAPRFLDPALAGGTVLDAGVYGFWFARFALGPITEVQALGSVLPSGVEDQAVALLRTASNRVGTVSMTMAGRNTGLASVVGTRGTARFLDPFVFPARFVVETPQGERVWKHDSALLLRDGLAWQAAAVAHHIGEGRTDSPIHPIDDAIAVLHLLDAVRSQVLGTSAVPA